MQMYKVKMNSQSLFRLILNKSFKDLIFSSKTFKDRNF
jgi:hypothetical protein